MPYKNVKDLPESVQKNLPEHAQKIYYIGSAEGHEYPDLQVGDEVNPRLFLGLKSLVK